MTDSVLQQLVDQDFGIEGRGKWYHSIQHDSLVVNAEDGTWFWNSRGLRGNAKDYLVLIRGYSKIEADNFLKNSFGGFIDSSPQGKISTPYEKLVEIMWDNGKDKRDYWYDRNLTDATIDRYKLGHYNGWNLIPMYFDGEFVNFQLRRDIPAKKIDQWYRTGKVYLYNEGILPFTNVVYITEGTVDAILLNQEGLPAVSPNGTNTWQKDWFYKFAHIREVYYVEDNDKAGRIGARLVANNLGTGRVKIISYEGKPEKYDTVDLFRDGGTINTFKEYVQESKFLFQLEEVYGRASNIGKSKRSLLWQR